MGSKPAIPNNLSHDGQVFIRKCLEVDPNIRWNIHSLQDHPFVKVRLIVVFSLSFAEGKRQCINLLFVNGLFLAQKKIETYKIRIA